MTIFGRRRAAGDKLLIALLEQCPELPEWDRTIVARCRVQLAVQPGGPQSGNSTRPVGKAAVFLLLTNSSLVIPTLTGMRAFHLGTLGLTPQGEFMVIFMAGGDFYFARAYSARELALFVRLFNITSDWVQEVEREKPKPQ